MKVILYIRIRSELGNACWQGGKARYTTSAENVERMARSNSVYQQVSCCFHMMRLPRLLQMLSKSYFVKNILQAVYHNILLNMQLARWQGKIQKFLRKSQIACRL